MSAIHFSNFELEDDTDYFFYIGELKNYGLNNFLKESLSRIFNRKFSFIAIVPDVFEQYNYENLIVINPLTKLYKCKYGYNVNCRISAREFMQSITDSREIRALIKRILRRQDHLYIYMYESMPEMGLDEIDGVSVIGPDKYVSDRLNSKIYQYENLVDMVPIVDFHICNGLNELKKITDTLWLKWKNGIFVTSEYSAAGVNSIVAKSPRDISAKFTDTKGPYLISGFIPHEYDPTVLAVVANEEDVYIAGVADQRIEDGTRFTGSMFPSVLDSETIEKLKEYTVKVGEWLATKGYRGIFGCDYLVTKDKDIRFLEINARKQGTTLEFCCTLEQSLPPNAPNLPELEFYAVTEGVFPANTVEMKSNLKNIHWGTYNYKIKNPIKTESYIPQSVMEREAFRKIAKGNLKKDFLILEHTGSDFIVAQGAFIGRIVSLGQDHKSVIQGLKQGQKFIDLTICHEHKELPEKIYA